MSKLFLDRNKMGFVIKAELKKINLLIFIPVILYHLYTLGFANGIVNKYTYGQQMCQKNLQRTEKLK